MTYLAAAWNTNNMANLKHVTQGAARQLLLGMHREAVNLNLKSCALRKDGKGDYLLHLHPRLTRSGSRPRTAGPPEGGRNSSQHRHRASVGTCSRTRAAADAAVAMTGDFATPGGQPEVAKSPRRYEPAAELRSAAAGTGAVRGGHPR